MKTSWKKLFDSRTILKTNKGETEKRKFFRIVTILDYVSPKIRRGFRFQDSNKDPEKNVTNFRKYTQG